MLEADVTKKAEYGIVFSQGNGSLEILENARKLILSCVSISNAILPTALL